MSKPKDAIWLDGEILPAHAPLFAASERGFALGDGLFETMRMEGAKPCFFADHWSRLCASAAFLQIPLPWDCEAVQKALCTLASRNMIRSGAARLVLTRGAGPRGLAVPDQAHPHMLITLTPALPTFKAPPVLGLSSLRRNRWSVTSAHKTLSYIDGVAARLHQLGTERHDEVVLLDTDGHVASASAANLFWWRDGTLYTPALNGAVLPGTMRARVLAQAHRIDIGLREGGFSPKALLKAEGAFMSNALIGMVELAGLEFGRLGQTVFSGRMRTVASLRPLLRVR